MGGVRRLSLFALSGNHRSLVCHRLQMGAARTSDAREADRMQEVSCIAWSLDEKMGQTYIHKECANTLAQRDYKQPQAVIYELSREDRTTDGE